MQVGAVFFHLKSNVSALVCVSTSGHKDSTHSPISTARSSYLTCHSVSVSASDSDLFQAGEPHKYRGFWSAYIGDIPISQCFFANLDKNQIAQVSLLVACSPGKEDPARERNTMDGGNVAPRRMPLHLLEEITNGFSKDRKVGAGSYGNVYKGELKNGETIAVKVLHYIPGLDDEQFEMEYRNLASLEHENVVRLVGYCHETLREVLPFNGKMVFAEMTKRALCFDYLHNGSLDKYLSDEFNGHDWQTRYAIIKGICQGLKYLHEELQSPMYHLDLKPANVLLDDNMVPKLTDFGLSRLFGVEQTQMTTSAIGTLGYVPPEYIDAGIISNKFDVFSLGVVIIKIMTGPTGYYRSAEMSSEEFIELVHANWTKRLHAASVYLLDSFSEQVRRCIEIALSCVDADRYKRPSIGLIVRMLNETETMDIGSSMYKICRCISTGSELMDIPLNKLISYRLHVTDNRGKLHETTICQPEDGTTTFEPIRPKIKIIEYMGGLGRVYTIDVHPTEPWILIGHFFGHASVWNHQTQERLMTFDIPNKTSNRLSAVRFILQKQWIIAGDCEGHILVYTYTTKDKLKEFQAHATWVNSLAVHPTDPFVLSSSYDNLIKLWNWENDWECIRTFRAHTKDVKSVKFSPLTASNTFASASKDGTIKIWSMFSDTPITTLECGTAELMSVDYFIVRGNVEYIVAGSDCGTAHIWDLETKTCIRHIEGLQDYAGVAVVDCLPGHPILVTVSRDNTVSFCNSTTHRYQNKIDFKLGHVVAFGYIRGPRSLVVAGLGGIAIMEIS